jgi:hypothetical protein
LSILAWGNQSPRSTNIDKEPQMRILRTIALAAATAAAGALALGSAALAQETNKPEAKPGHGHQHGKNRMREMRGGCHGGLPAAAAAHDRNHEPGAGH